MQSGDVESGCTDSAEGGGVPDGHVGCRFGLLEVVHTWLKKSRAPLCRSGDGDCFGGVFVVANHDVGGSAFESFDIDGEEGLGAIVHQVLCAVVGYWCDSEVKPRLILDNHAGVDFRSCRADCVGCDVGHFVGDGVNLPFRGCGTDGCESCDKS